VRRVSTREGLCYGGSQANASAFAMVIAQGEVWWADLPEPSGSEPGFRRPVIVVQGDAFNRSRIDTVVCVPLTSTLRWADAPGNVLLEARMTGLPKDSVVNVSQIVTLDRASLTKRVGKLSSAKLELVLFGIDVVLGR
jgi:mRNA interferase MazF